LVAADAEKAVLRTSAAESTIFASVNILAALGWASLVPTCDPNWTAVNGQILEVANAWFIPDKNVFVNAE
jgi:hypothetical protein